MSTGPFITDAEIAAALVGVPGAYLEIDALDRNPTTQKPEGRDARPRAAVVAALAARGVALNLD